MGVPPPGCMGTKLQSHIPAQVNMGHIFRKKNMGPLHTRELHSRFKEKRLYFSRTISKNGQNGHLFLCENDPSQWLRVSRLKHARRTQMRVCHPRGAQVWFW